MTATGVRRVFADSPEDNGTVSSQAGYAASAIVGLESGGRNVSLRGCAASARQTSPIGHSLGEGKRVELTPLFPAGTKLGVAERSPAGREGFEP
jgi:hypothetical protein